MALDSGTVQAIQDLVANDPAIQQDLRASTSQQDFSHRLTSAARANGIVVDEQDLVRHYDLASWSDGSGQMLSDGELSLVAGGRVPQTAFEWLSVKINNLIALWSRPSRPG